MYTFLSQLPTARKSPVGENCRSDILSDGSWPWGISTSLLVSPVVELAAAAGALDPKSAIVVVCGLGSVDVEALRELVVVPRCYGREDSRMRLSCSRLCNCSEWLYHRECAVDYLATRRYDASLCPFTVVALTLVRKRSARPSKLPGTLASPPSAAFGQTLRRTSASLNIFLNLRPFPPQRSSLKESQRSTHTERALSCLDLALGESPRTPVFSTALSATDRHRSAASYRYDPSSPSFPPALFSFAFPTPRVEGPAPGR
jgi:hypothetical protein